MNGLLGLLQGLGGAVQDPGTALAGGLHGLLGMLQGQHAQQPLAPQSAGYGGDPQISLAGVPYDPAAANAPPQGGQDQGGGQQQSQQMQLPPPPVAQTTNHFGDLLDNLTGGHFAAIRRMELGQQIQQYNTAMMQQGMGKIADPVEREAYRLDPTEWAKTQLTNRTDVKGSPGDVMMNGADGIVTRQVPFKREYQHFPKSDVGFPFDPNGPQVGVAGPSAPSAPGVPPMAGPAITGGPGAPSPMPPASPPGSGVLGQIRGRPSFQALSPDDQSTLLAIGKTESSLKPGARNGSSTGVFQFHPDTFAALGGKDINDLGQQTDAAAALLQQNKGALSQALGRDPSPSELYLAHQQGIGGAKAILSAPAGTNAVMALVGAGVPLAKARASIVGNGGTPTMTTDQFAATWQRKFGQRLASVQGAGDGAGTPTQSTNGYTVPPPPPPPDGSVSVDSSIPSAANGYVHQGQEARPLTDLNERAKRGISAADHNAYTLNPDGTFTKSADAPLSIKDLQDMRAKWADSDEYKKSGEAVAAYNGLVAALKSATGKNNGILDSAAVDSFLRGINPGMGAKNSTVSMVLEHIGLPEELRGKVLSVTGNGYLTPNTLRQMVGVIHDYGQAHLGIAANRAASDATVAARFGYSADDLGERLPTMVDAPKSGLGAPPQRRVNSPNVQPSAPPSPGGPSPRPPASQAPSGQGGSQVGGANSGVPRVANAADYAKIPSGSRYVDPNGHVRTKR